MSTNTENYNLIKPDQEDFYNVDDFNNNADIIDSQLKTLSDGLGSAAQESTVNSINTKIGETENTGGSTTAGTIFAKLNKIISDVTTHMGRWTATRAGYIDTINSNAASAKTAATNAQSYTATNNTASKTGILSQKESYTHSLLENATYGLNAIKTKLNNVSVVKSVQRGVVNEFNNDEISTYSLKVSTVNSAKSILIINTPTETFEDGSSAIYFNPYATLSEDGTTITFNATQRFSVKNFYFEYSWQLIEFY